MPDPKNVGVGALVVGGVVAAAVTAQVLTSPPAGSASGVASIGAVTAAGPPDVVCSDGTLPTGAHVTPAAGGAPATFECNGKTIAFDGKVPPDANLAGQLGADCFAWWELISLDWPAGDATFGQPGDLGAVQWETFIEESTLFQPGGAPPPAWNGGVAPASPTPACGGQGSRILKQTSKFDGAEIPPTMFGDGAVGEALPARGPAWLGAQHGGNLWFEVRTSKDEYDYIVANKLYDADSQLAWVSAGKPISLPMGGALDGGVPQTGAIEIKAAWMEVADYDPASPKWQTYKLTSGAILDRTTGSCRQTTLALVGLHILHKTLNQPTWIWATFEHVDTAPDAAALDAGVPDGGYDFYDPSCAPRSLTMDGGCVPEGGAGEVTVNVSCQPDQPPPYNLGPGCPGPVPLQVTRALPIEGCARWASWVSQRAIEEVFPGSVWSHYQLVGTIWSNGSNTPPIAPQKTPLRPLGMQPTGPVANTLLETFVQSARCGTGHVEACSCTSCHVNAGLAPTAAGRTKWASDFSFMLSNARYAAGGPR